jgi:MFS family permease
VQRPPVPAVIRDLYRDPSDARTLVVAALALAAAGLDPRVFNPGLASVQEAVRARPDVEQLLLIAAVASALVLLVGGVLGDTDGRRRVQVGALGVLVLTGLSGLLFNDGPIFLAGRLCGVIAAAVILPFSLAGVAVTYQGIPRATAIGFAYAAFGAGSAAGPVLLTLFGPSGAHWPAFVASTIVASIAFVMARRHWPDLPSPSRRQRRRVIATAVWAAGVILTCMGLVGFGHGVIDVVRLAFLFGGLAVIGIATGLERGITHDDAVHVERRPVAMALLVGFVIAFAQSATLLQLPLFFQLINGYGPLVAVIATLPFIIALIVTGPIVGVLLSRVGPRPLITVGVLAVGLGNVILALALAPRASYIFFVIPLAFIGSGFVIATTVRTAIIFASVPRGLPATAAALNEASVAMGTRAGLVVGTLLIATMAVTNLTASMAGQPPATIDAAVAVLRDLLVAIGTPGYGALVEGVAQPERLEFATAYTDAVRTFLGVTGIVTLVAAAITWLLVGRRDPLTTVWEHRDERAEALA